MEFDRILLYLIAAWFTIEGIVSIVLAIQVKDINSGWYWGLIFGILAVLVGIYAFAHPMFTAVTTGILVGIFFLCYAAIKKVPARRIEPEKTNYRPPKKSAR